MSVPWFIGQPGAHHSAEVARQVAYAATSGEDGVITATDMKVTALDSPAGRVRIGTGGACMLNRSPGGAGQSYIDRLSYVDEIDIPATSSSGGRSDLICRVVEDPQYEGHSVPSDVANGPYSRTRRFAVPAGTTLASTLNLGYPAVALARIDIPANTTAITNGMIKDVRKVANPRNLRRTQTFTISTPQGLNTTSNIWWPSEAEWTVDVPEWAAIHKIRADVTNIVNLDANFEGYLEVIISSTVQATARIDIPWAGSTGRHNLIVSGETPVGVEHRGGTVPVRLRARRSAGTGWLNATNLSQVIYDIEFTEAAI